MKVARAKLKLRQEDFAEMLGVQRVAYTRYETGTRPVPAEILFRARKIAKISPAKFVKMLEEELL